MRTNGVWLLAGVLAPSVAWGAPTLEYNHDIRPILAENCFACHGPDSAARKGDLRLDQREAAVKMKAIVPGKPTDSTILKRVTSTDPDEVMPPASTHKKLTAKQVDTLRTWIASGAEYQAHWSLLPVKRPTPPTVKRGDWVRSPMDAFVLARLEAAGLAPAPEADRRALARRACLDLTGLLPEPADVQAFVDDRRPDAYERYVDKLLASPAWGEHRGRYWLDYARYADTHGLHFDNFREMWTYRDWVIQAFNRNLPFDQFTIEQLAGDLLPKRTLDQQIASGFNRCNITTNEGGVIAEEYLVLYTRDRTEAVSQIWMGLTAGCAVCHEHKFDPLSQREFYEMAAFFNNSGQGAMDGNIKDTPPTVFVPIQADRGRWETVQVDLQENRKRADERRSAGRAEFDKHMTSVKHQDLAKEIPAQGLVFHAELDEGGGDLVKYYFAGAKRDAPLVRPGKWAKGHVGVKAYQTTPDSLLEFPDAGDFDTKQPFTVSAWVNVPAKTRYAAIAARMEEANGRHRGWDLWMDSEQLGMHLVNNWSDSAIKVVTDGLMPSKAWHHVVVTYDGSSKGAGIKFYIDGKIQPAKIQNDNLAGTIRTKTGFKVGQREQGVKLKNLAIQDLRLYDRVLSSADAEALALSTRIVFLAKTSKEKRSASENDEMFHWWLETQDPVSRDLSAKRMAFEQELAGIESRGSKAHVMTESNQEPMAYVLFRGDYDKRRDAVKAKTPAMLPPMPAALPRNRLGFAQWLLAPEHPLTARVTVNRYWQEVFGAGLVRTSGDFGVAGELPSHPELLDWLAVEFREGGWDVKKFFKMMVTSATYRQSASATPEKIEKDPANRLYSRGPRFRMDGEMLRDTALSASGLLVRTIGGPSVKPYQPEGVWEAVAMMESNTRYYQQDRGEKLYRRGLYTFWKRAAPPASLDIFNAPSREFCAVRRERTNTPLQALVTLNDPQFVEAARNLAERTLKGSGDDISMIQSMAQRLLCRPLVPRELAIAQDSLLQLSNYYRANPAHAKELLTVGESKPDPNLEAPRLASWTMLANQLMNLDETLNK